jgi:hypothetical protein
VDVLARLSGPILKHRQEHAQAIVGAAPAAETSKTWSPGSSTLVTVLVASKGTVTILSTHFSCLS